MQPYEMLEERFTDWIGSGGSLHNMVACSSGTAALHLALESMKLAICSKVIVPDYTMIACPRSVILARQIPVFVGVGQDYLIDLDMLPRLLDNESSVSAIMVVHVYGRKVNMDRVHGLAFRYGLKVIEDLAEAHGITPHPRTDAACWSFYQNKVIAGEEGGAIYFKNPKHAATARCLRSMGFTQAHDYQHIPRGHNYRLANCLANKILDSLVSYPANVIARRTRETWYDTQCPEEWKNPYRQVPWVYDLRIPNMDKSLQDKVIGTLRRNDIAARYGFYPMHKQEEFKNCNYYPGEMNTQHLAASTVYLPLTPELVTEEYATKAMVIMKSLA